MLIVACNDMAGEVSNRCDGLWVGSAAFEPTSGSCVAFAECSNPARIVLDGRPWRLSARVEWPGSMALMGYQLAVAPGGDPLLRMASFMRALKRGGAWHCSCGPSDLFGWFNSDDARADDKMLALWIACALED